MNVFAALTNKKFYTRRYSKIYRKCAVEISKNKENF